MTLNFPSKLTCVATERSAQKHAEYIVHIGPYSCNQLVFVDESACDWHTTYWGHTWAISGQRSIHKAFFVHGKRWACVFMSPHCLTICYARYSILPVLSLDGILYVDIIEGSYNMESFVIFIEGLLDQMNPFPQPNSVIVMDNCHIHKCPDILNMITTR